MPPVDPAAPSPVELDTALRHACAACGAQPVGFLLLEVHTPTEVTLQYFCLHYLDQA